MSVLEFKRKPKVTVTRPIDPDIDAEVRAEMRRKFSMAGAKADFEARRAGVSAMHPILKTEMVNELSKSGSGHTTASKARAARAVTTVKRSGGRVLAFKSQPRVPAGQSTGGQWTK